MCREDNALCLKRSRQAVLPILEFGTELIGNLGLYLDALCVRHSAELRHNNSKLALCFEQMAEERWGKISIGWIPHPQIAIPG
jgi:hypothetical protein